MSDKKFQNWSSIFFEENYDTIADAFKVFKICNNFSISVVSVTGFDDDSGSAKNAIHEYPIHPCVE